MDSTAKVLIVDDDEIILAATRIFLEGAGFEVATEQSALRLSRAIRENPPDLILLDVRMPALNGDQVLVILKRYDFSRDIPVLLFSDLAEEELAELVRTTDADGYVKKSAGSENLIRQVKSFIRVADPVT